MSETWALLPLKRLDRAKRRLARIMDAGTRRALALAMARDVLSALHDARVADRTVLVTNEPEAGNLLHGGELEVFYSDRREGLNREVEQAAEFAGAQGAGRILLVHADLPYLTANALDRVARQAPADTVCVAACRRRTGTNLLIAPLPLSLEPVFGRDSLASFRRQAEERSVDLAVVHHPQLESDIDVPEDFERLVQSADSGRVPGQATRAFLTRLGHSARGRKVRPMDAPAAVHRVRPIAGRAK